MDVFMPLQNGSRCPRDEQERPFGAVVLVLGFAIDFLVHESLELPTVEKWNFFAVDVKKSHWEVALSSDAATILTGIFGVKPTSAAMAARKKSNICSLDENTVTEQGARLTTFSGCGQARKFGPNKEK